MFAFWAPTMGLGRNANYFREASQKIWGLCSGERKGLNFGENCLLFSGNRLLSDWVSFSYIIYILFTNKIFEKGSLTLGG